MYYHHNGMFGISEEAFEAIADEGTLLAVVEHIHEDSGNRVTVVEYHVLDGDGEIDYARRSINTDPQSIPPNEYDPYTEYHETAWCTLLDDTSHKRAEVVREFIEDEQRREADSRRDQDEDVRSEFTWRVLHVNEDAMDNPEELADIDGVTVSQ